MFCKGAGGAVFSYFLYEFSDPVIAMYGKEPKVRELIDRWIRYRSYLAEPNRYLILKSDLYTVRNAVGGTTYPRQLVDVDDEIMASVEHYFLCRAWVGNAVYPAAQVRAMKGIYNTGKIFGLTPRHNPAKPVTPLSAMQTMFQDEGIRDGEADLKASGKSAPGLTMPNKYW